MGLTQAVANGCERLRTCGRLRTVTRRRANTTPPPDPESPCYAFGKTCSNIRNHIVTPRAFFISPSCSFMPGGSSIGTSPLTPQTLHQGKKNCSDPPFKSRNRLKAHFLDKKTRQRSPERLPWPLFLSPCGEAPPGPGTGFRAVFLCFCSIFLTDRF